MPAAFASKTLANLLCLSVTKSREYSPLKRLGETYSVCNGKIS